MAKQKDAGTIFPRLALISRIWYALSSIDVPTLLSAWMIGIFMVYNPVEQGHVLEVRYSQPGTP
jgi:hypothetical protein